MRAPGRRRSPLAMRTPRPVSPAALLAAATLGLGGLAPARPPAGRQAPAPGQDGPAPPGRAAAGPGAAAARPSFKRRDTVSADELRRQLASAPEVGLGDAAPLVLAG